MDDLSRQVLRDNYVIILKDLETDDILIHMFQSGVFSDDDCERVKIAGTRKQCGQVFLDLLPRRGKNAYDVFVKALEDELLSHLAEKLKNYETELQKKQETCLKNFDDVDGGPEAAAPVTPAPVPSANQSIESSCSWSRSNQHTDSYRPGSGTNYPIFPLKNSGSGSNLSTTSSYSGSGANQSAESYRPGSGTHYPMAPVINISCPGHEANQSTKSSHSGSGANQSEESYRPGSGTNYSIFPVKK